LQRKVSDETILAITVTRNLEPASRLAFEEAEELQALTTIVNEWADRYEALG
jgi:hypothetical protein